MVPYCPITVKSTREIAGFNGLAEALLRLDFIRAVSDIRRFHYVSHLMFLLFAHDKLSQLPGAAQKVLFRMLYEEIIVPRSFMICFHVVFNNLPSVAISSFQFFENDKLFSLIRLL